MSLVLIQCIIYFNCLNYRYKGPCILDLINSIELPRLEIDKPLRLTISNSFTSTNHGKIKGTCISGIKLIFYV